MPYRARLIFPSLLAPWIAIAAAWLAPALAEEAVDLVLVLAIDASGSVDEDEYRLQLQGTANGIRDPDVFDAIRSGPLGRIAVSVLIWADAMLPPAVTDWHIIATEADAESLARKIENLPRSVDGGTGIGAAIVASIRHMDANAITAARRVVDVSGDGIETPARRVGAIQVREARAMAAARGVIVNGLAILSDVYDLNRWYSANVTIGAGSFVIIAQGFDDFERAMRQKLLREIQTPVAEIQTKSKLRRLVLHHYP